MDKILQDIIELRTDISIGLDNETSSIVSRLLQIQNQINELKIYKIRKSFSSAEKMAEWLHNNYEEIALNNGWKTQESCQVPFNDLPKENKQVMIELCERFLNL